MANSMNFCPRCGQRLSPEFKCCPNCGRKLSDSGDSALTKVGSMASQAKDKAVGFFKEKRQSISRWDREIVRTSALVVPENASDKVLFKGKGYCSFGKHVSSSTTGRFEMTRTAIHFYDVPTLKSFLPGKQEASEYVCGIEYADIESVKKETALIGGYSYSMIVNGEECTFGFVKNESRFVNCLLKLAGFSDTLLNVELRPDEKLIEASDIKCKTGGVVPIWRDGTIYYTNQRIIVNKAEGQWEGTDVYFESELSNIRDIREDVGAMNCEYCIISSRDNVLIKFEGVVPEWFLKLAPNAQGNAQQLKRKGTAMKGLKVAMVAASLIGLSASDDADVDDDVDADDDIDVDDDMDDDGVILDTDGDGEYDTIGVDSDGDGYVDTVGVDTDGDGAIDTVGVDTDGDGAIDTVAVDADGDGYVDAVGVDSNGDGAIDTVGVDTDGDGYVDTVGVDTDGDGAIDTVGVDTDGDGAIDTVGVDTDGDGAIDTVAVDADGDGYVDAVGVDTDGDGVIDSVVEAVGGAAGVSAGGGSVNSKAAAAAAVAAGAAVVGAAVASKVKAKNRAVAPVTEQVKQKGGKTAMIVGISAFVVAVIILVVALFVAGGRSEEVVYYEEYTTEVTQEVTSTEDRVYSNSYDGYTNVRRGPSSKAEIIGELRNGNDYVVVTGETEGWYEVQYLGQMGYVHKNYVSESPSIPVTVDVTAEWLEGIWFTHLGFQAYLIFSNGKYTLVGEWYENIVAGRWHLEGEYIVLTPKYFDKKSRWWDDSFRRPVRLRIRKSAGMIGDSQKSSFGDPNDPEYRQQGSMDWSKADFNAERKWVNARVK